MPETNHIKLTSGEDDLKQGSNIETALRENEERYRTLIEILPDAVYVFSEARVEFANKAGHDLLGIKSLDELKDKSMMDFIHPDCRKHTAPFVEEKIIRTDGTVVEVEVTGVPLTFQGKQAVEVIVRDITNRKLAEKNLQEKEAHLRRIADNMLDIITQVDSSGIIQYASPSAKKIMGYEPTALLGRCALNFVHPDDLSRVTQAFQLFITGQGEGKSDFRFRHRQGHYIWLESVGNQLFDDNGTISGAIISTRDISQRRQLMKEFTRLDQLNLVGEMAAGMGHEIRNPMTTARGFLQLLREKTECTNYVEYFDLIIAELDRANSIISEFLSMAKNKKINLRNCCLNSVVRALTPLIQADAALDDKSILFHLADVPDLLVDEKEIRQLVLNLVLNGLEAMDRKGKLTIQTFVEDSAVVLSVKDEGRGIDPDSLDKIGTPFFTTKEKGTGLGLAICYSIAARHHANIDIKTGPTGTTFLIKFKQPESSDCISIPVDSRLSPATSVNIC